MESNQRTQLPFLPRDSIGGLELLTTFIVNVGLAEKACMMLGKGNRGSFSSASWW